MAGRLLFWQQKPFYSINPDGGISRSGSSCPYDGERSGGKLRWPHSGCRSTQLRQIRQQVIGGYMATKDDLDNHSNQLNPNNDAYWESRDWDERPDDWEDRQSSGDLLPSD